MTPWWMKPYEYTHSGRMWEQHQGVRDYHPNWIIEGGYALLVEQYPGEPPFYEPDPMECIIVRPIMKCWGRGLDHDRS